MDQVSWRFFWHFMHFFSLLPQLQTCFFFFWSKLCSFEYREYLVGTKAEWSESDDDDGFFFVVSQIEPRDECATALTKMTSCSACQGISNAKPCSSYCLNVMKGCLAYHAELGLSWDKFIGKCMSLIELWSLKNKRWDKMKSAKLIDLLPKAKACLDKSLVRRQLRKVEKFDPDLAKALILHTHPKLFCPKVLAEILLIVQIRQFSCKLPAFLDPSLYI